MNLVSDPWIPVVMLDKTPRLVSLNEVFRDGETIADLAANPCQRIALMRLLICIAQAALDGPKDFLAERNAAFRARRDLVVERLDAIDGLACPTPEGAFYVYPDAGGLIGRATPEGVMLSNDADLAEYLLAEARVAVVPGAAFGLSPAFRVSYATSREILETACERIARACARLG